MSKIKDHYFKKINSDDDGYDKYLEEIEVARFDAEQYVMSAYEDVVKEINDMSDVLMEIKGNVSRINGRH